MSILGRDTCQSAAICIYAVRAVAVAKRREYLKTELGVSEMSFFYRHVCESRQNYTCTWCKQLFEVVAASSP